VGTGRRVAWQVEALSRTLAAMLHAGPRYGPARQQLGGGVR
jgi:hypothetical protein